MLEEKKILILLGSNWTVEYKYVACGSRLVRVVTINDNPSVRGPPKRAQRPSSCPRPRSTMITPRFSCSQNDRSVVVSAYCPAVRASEIEIHVEDTLLSLHVAPYFLRLNFPASVVEDDQSSAVYDPASGYLTLTLTKLKGGEDFPDLDLLGKLLAPPAQSAPRNPTIEVLGSQDSSGGHAVDPGAAEHNEISKGEHPCTLRRFFPILYNQLTSENVAAANAWTIPQAVSDTLPALETSLRKPYGFLNAYTGYFLHVGTTANEINELGADAETLSPSERRTRRLRHEESKWDPEYYMCVVPFSSKSKKRKKRLTRKNIILEMIVVAVAMITVNTAPPFAFDQGGLCGSRANRTTHRMDTPASRIACSRRRLHRS